MNRDEALHLLEQLDSQVGNGGFYQYYYNVLARMGEPRTTEPLKRLIGLVNLGQRAGYNYYVTLGSILLEYFAIIEIHFAEDTQGMDEEEIEGREDYLSDMCDGFDERYYKIKEYVVDQFKDLAILAGQTGDVHITGTITDPQSLPGRLTVVKSDASEE